MIVIAGTAPINPAHLPEATQAALEMAAASQAEPGCLTYRFYADLEDPHRFFIFEVWESEEALQAHFQTPHMATFQEKLPQYLAGQPQIKRYEVESVQDS